LEKQEKKHFDVWLERVYSLCPKEELSFFEHNIEVWRQLWRVCEISDMIVIVVDARHPVLNFPPTLYEYIVLKLKKKMCLALTKSDIVGETVVAAWTEYIKGKFPEVSIVNCSVYDLDFLRRGDEKRPKRYKNSFGVDNLI
jgi:ribosome biogenesis GTPase A